MRKKKIREVGIVGIGYVGSAMERFFDDRGDIALSLYDEFRTQSENFTSMNGYRKAFGSGERNHFGDFDPIPLRELKIQRDVFSKNLDLAVICVPTPSLPDEGCDTSIVESCVKWLRERDVPRILIKSTVEPGTTERLIQKYGDGIAFSPEFGGNSSYWTPFSFDHDFKDAGWHIFGGRKETTSWLVDLWTEIAGPMKHYFQTDPTTAEMVKYAANCFYATKVAFVDELAQLCDDIGVDYTELREMWTQDPRISKMHTARFRKSPGFSESHCFNKDVPALISFAERFGGNLSTLRGALEASRRMAQEKDE